MPQTKPVIAIVNVVASATIDQKLDLVDITKNSQMWNTILNNSREQCLD